MRLLLTRALEEAARTRAALEARGHRVLLSPVLRFARTGEFMPRRAPHAVIATSARAFANAEASSWDVAAVPLALVGGRTEEAARVAGFTGPATIAATSAELAALLLRGRPAKRLLYLAGVDRKPDLEAALDAGPHRLTVIETYEAVAATTLSPDAEAALREGEIDAVLHYSRRSAEIFLGLCHAAALDARAPHHLCLSPDVAEAFGGFRCVRVAGAPDEAALLALVEGL